MGERRVCDCDKRPDRQAGRPGVNPATGQRWTWDTLPTCECPVWEPVDPTLADAIRETVEWITDAVYETSRAMHSGRAVAPGLHDQIAANATLAHLLDGAP